MSSKCQPLSRSVLRTGREKTLLTPALELSLGDGNARCHTSGDDCFDGKFHTFYNSPRAVLAAIGVNFDVVIGTRGPEERGLSHEPWLEHRNRDAGSDRRDPSTRAGARGRLDWAIGTRNFLICNFTSFKICDV
jgi:hypothetical protein